MHVHVVTWDTASASDISVRAELLLQLHSCTSHSNGVHYASCQVVLFSDLPCHAVAG